MIERKGLSLLLTALIICLLVVSCSSESSIISGALPGKFTVDDDGNTVAFSKGNLQAVFNKRVAKNEYAITTWKFANHQYDFVGGEEFPDLNPAKKTGNNNIICSGVGVNEPTLSAPGVVDLFGWSTENNYYGINTDDIDHLDAYLGDFVDWGENIGNGQTWRTLSIDEWDYILFYRGNDDFSRWALIKVKGIPGLLLFPDEFNWNENTMGEYPEYTDKDILLELNWNYVKSYDLKKFNAMEEAGCVFLPTAGSRNGIKVYDESQNPYWGYGGIHTSDLLDDTGTYCWTFNAEGVDTNCPNLRCFGYSVRLVTSDI